MKKAAVTAIALAVLFSGTAALAADTVTYTDEDLGFTIDMPGDFEYYGDYVDELAGMIDASGIEKQPLYVGYDANMNITYSTSEKDFEDLYKGLPDSVSKDELDYYHFTEENKETFADTFFEEMENTDISQTGLDMQVLSYEWVDYNGKLCLFGIVKGYNSEYDVDYYQGSLNFIYKGYFIAVTYTKFDLYGNLSLNEATEEIGECFKTIHFETVPSDTQAKLSSGITFDWTKIAIWAVSGAVTGGLTWLIVYLIIKKRDKKRYSGGNYENGPYGED